jgi:hypothetical protein
VVTAIAFQLGASAAVAAPAAGLALRLQHGLPTEPVIAAVQTSTDSVLCLGDFLVTFSWDGIVVRRVAMDADCLAVVRFRPPRQDRDPGSHVVRAQIENTSVVFVAAYTVDPMVAGEPDQLPSDTPSEATGDNPGASPGDPGGSPADPASADPTASASAEDSVDGAGTPSAATGTVVGAAGPVDPPRALDALDGVWPFLFGGFLILAGVVMLGFVAVGARRAP